MSRFPSSVPSPKDAAESRSQFLTRANFALEYSANQSLFLEKTDKVDENFMTVAFAKLHRAAQGKSRNPDPGIDPQTKYDNPRRLEDVDLVNHALKHAATKRHIGTELNFGALLGLYTWRALLLVAVSTGLLVFVVSWAFGSGFDVWDIAVVLTPIVGGAV